MSNYRTRVKTLRSVRNTEGFYVKNKYSSSFNFTFTHLDSITDKTNSSYLLGNTYYDYIRNYNEAGVVDSYYLFDDAIEEQEIIT